MRTTASTCALLLSFLVACGPPQAPPTARPVETKEDLILALGDAGAWVARSGDTELGLFGTPGEVLVVDGVAIEVYAYPSREAREQVSLTIAPDGSSIAGQPIDWIGKPHLWAQGGILVVYQGSHGPTILLLDAILGEALVRPASSGEEPYPPAVTAAIGALAQALQIDPAEVEVLGFEEREWPDGCLGLAAPDEVCAMVITPGWRVSLRAGVQDYAVRTDAAGIVVRLE